MLLLTSHLSIHSLHPPNRLHRGYVPNLPPTIVTGHQLFSSGAELVEQILVRYFSFPQLRLLTCCDIADLRMFYVNNPKPATLCKGFKCCIPWEAARALAWGPYSCLNSERYADQTRMATSDEMLRTGIPRPRALNILGSTVSESTFIYRPPLSVLLIDPTTRCLRLLSRYVPPPDLTLPLTRHSAIQRPTLCAPSR